MSDLSKRKKKTVVFIDDDHGPIDRYVEKLERSGFDVVRIDTIQGALNFLSEVATSGKKVDLWTLDIMMPVGREELLIDGKPLKSVTEYGLTSGLHIFRQLRAVFPKAPVILLTSITTPDILDSIELGEHTQCQSKLAVVPSEFVRLVEATLAQSTDRKPA